MIHTFYDSAVAADATGVVKTVKRVHENGTLQVKIVTTATVTVEGSLNGTDWFLIVTKTASDLIAIAVCPFMRVKITSWTAGAVTVLLAE